MDKDKLKQKVSEEITELFEGVLDFAEVAIASPETYKRYRSKVLRIGNNCIRALHRYVDEEAEDVTEHRCDVYGYRGQCMCCEPCVNRENTDD